MTSMRHGRPLLLRHVATDDEPALPAFMQALSPASRRLRFFSVACNLAEAAHWAAGADGSDRIGILATDLAGQILGHAVCCRLPGSRAEVAVEVSETHRHLGLATILIVRLAAEAEQQGIRSFVAEVLPDNREMLAVFSDGFDASRTAAYWGGRHRISHRCVAASGFPPRAPSAVAVNARRQVLQGPFRAPG